MTPVLAIIGVCISLLGSVVAITAVIVQMKTNMASLSKQDDRQEQREDKAAKEVSDLLVLLKSFISAQTEINMASSKALEAVVRKLEDLEKRTVESSSVVTLLAEVLKAHRSPGAIQ